MKVHAEISYINSQAENVHSDICPPNCEFNDITPKYKEFLHQCLDEWLEKGDGSGEFYIRQEQQ